MRPCFIAVPHSPHGWAGSLHPLRGMAVAGITLPPQAGKPPLEEDEERAHLCALKEPDWD